MYNSYFVQQQTGNGADREKRLGNLNGFTGGSFAGMVYHPAWLSPSLTTMGGGGTNATHCGDL